MSYQGKNFLLNQNPGELTPCEISNFSLFIYLFIYLFILFIYFIYLFIYLFVCLFYLFVLFIYLFIYLFVCLFINLFIYSFIYLFTPCLSVATFFKCSNTQTKHFGWLEWTYICNFYRCRFDQDAPWRSLLKASASQDLYVNLGVY